MLNGMLIHGGACLQILHLNWQVEDQGAQLEADANTHTSIAAPDPWRLKYDLVLKGFISLDATDLQGLVAQIDCLEVDGLQKWHLT